MERLEPTRLLALKICWALAWRMAVSIFACAIVVAIFLTALNMLMGVSRGFLEAFNAILALIAVIVIPIEITYRLLGKKFRDFEIAAIPRQD